MENFLKNEGLLSGESLYFFLQFLISRVLTIPGAAPTSSSATDVETPAKGKWFVSIITTSTSDASPVKVGSPIS